MKLLFKSIFILGLLCLVFMISAKEMMPLSDLNNSQNWQLNPEVSDEFNGVTLDELKWFIQGKDAQFYLWKGRAPSQFAPHNVSVSNGFLKLTTQWQPEYKFIGTPPTKQEVTRYENITTAAIINRKSFLYGYMEVRVKIPDAAMTGAFWGTGYQQELDVFELIGRVKTGSRNPESTFVTSIHDWRPGHAKQNKVWKHKHKMAGRTADAFHVYGVEWLKDGLKMYLDGDLVHSVSQADMGDSWLLNNPLELWFDSEVFPWHGIPNKEELPVDFEIDYVRVWQQPDSNLLDRAFFGFEGPYISEARQMPEVRDLYAKNWWFDSASSKHFTISDFKDNQYATGRKSLRFTQQGALAKDEVVAFSPQGSVRIDEGNYQLTFKLWKEPNSKVQKINLILEDPWLVLAPIDIGDIKPSQWVEVSVPFKRKQQSGLKDRIRIVIKQSDAPADDSFFLIDDISISQQ